MPSITRHRHLLSSARLAALLCASAVAVLLLISASAASAAAVGVNVSGFDSTSAPKIEALVNDLHPAWVRVFLDWRADEPAQGVYNSGDLAEYKAFFAAIPATTKIDVDVVDTPQWASGSANAATPPVNDQVFGGFVGYLASYFGTRVSAWEIWNEEDATSWWNGTIPQYVALLQAADSSIKAIDPGSTVLLGGLTANDFTFLTKVYAAGGGADFDAVAVHTDDGCDDLAPGSFVFNAFSTSISGGSFLGFTTVRSVMVANGNAAKQIFMTELGWSTAGKDSGCTVGSKKTGGVSDKTQAKYLLQAYHCLAMPQYSYVEAAMWFDMVDYGTGKADSDHYGLLTPNYTTKPSFKALKQEAATGDRLTGGCGNFAGPRVTLLAPGKGETYSGSALLLKVVATGHKQPVAQIELKHDGKSILNFNRQDAHESGDTLSGEIDWQGARNLSIGDHTISATATYAGGLSTTVSVVVTHLAPPHKHHHH